MFLIKVGTDWARRFASASSAPVYEYEFTNKNSFSIMDFIGDPWAVYKFVARVYIREKTKILYIYKLYM